MSKCYSIYVPPREGQEANMREAALKYLKMANGQLQASINMLEDERYCIDVSHQILATISLLKKANERMLKEHMHHCVTDAFKEGTGEMKIDEVVSLFSKMID